MHDLHGRGAEMLPRPAVCKVDREHGTAVCAACAPSLQTHEQKTSGFSETPKTYRFGLTGVCVFINVSKPVASLLRQLSNVAVCGR